MLIWLPADPRPAAGGLQPVSPSPPRLAAGCASAQVPTFRLQCAWCRVDMNEAPQDAPISHGICPSCAVQVEAEDARAGQRLAAAIAQAAYNTLADPRD